MAFLDGTNIRTRYKAAGTAERGASAQRDAHEALGTKVKSYVDRLVSDLTKENAALGS